MELGGFASKVALLSSALPPELASRRLAMPRRKSYIHFGLCPRYRLSPSNSGPKAAPGAEPDFIRRPNGGT
jgi:hypothetical protein